MRASREEVLSLAGHIDYILEALRAIVEEAGRKARDFSCSSPTAFDLRGIGSLLHDFYTAVEDVFEVIAGRVNGSIPEGDTWHKELLLKMAIPIPDLRPAVISQDLRWHLDEYLRFRHVFRNVYGHLLDWKRIRPLLEGVETVHGQFQEEIDRFRAFLLELARGLAVQPEEPEGRIETKDG